MSTILPAPAVFITGANGGVGVATVRALSARGVHVYAGVRAPVPALSALAGVELVHCDVTKPDDVAAAARHVAERQRGGGLHAIINVMGPATVTQEFIPLLRRGEGRVINISATSARVALPFFGPIGASKAALESLSAAMRTELAPWHIPVVVIEPGAMQTEIFTKAALAARSSWDESKPDQRALYERQLEIFATTMGKQPLSSPDILAKVIVKATTARRPKRRYLAGRDARTAGFLAHLPAGMRERAITRFLGLHKLPSLVEA